MAALLLCPTAHAGTYIWQTTDASGTVTARSPVISGGSWYTYGDSPKPYSIGYSGSGGSAETGGYAGQISSTGTIRTVYTWQPSYAGEPAPPVVIEQTCEANYLCQTASAPADPCSNGLGDPLVDSSSGDTYKGKSSGTHYRVVSPDATGKIMVDLVGAQAHAPASSFTNCTVWYTINAYPVTINIIGCNANNQALTGQQITASLNIPSGFTGDVNTYQWSVVTTANPPVASDNVFETYIETANSHPFIALSTADLTGLHLNFYDKKKETVLVKCNVTLVAPDGITRIAAKAQSQPIAFLKPSLTSSSIINGYVYKDPLIANRWGLLPDPTTSYNDGIGWKDLTVNSPSPFPSGQCCLTQLVTPDRENYKDGVGADRVTNNKVLGLDNKFQVGPPSMGGPDPWVPPTLGNDSDSSGIYQTTAGDQHFNKITVADSFTTWVMYRPPAATYNGNALQTVWVPLAKSDWSWRCTLQWSNNAWTLAAATPLSVSTKPAYAFSATNDTPDWLVIHTNGH